MRSLTQRLAAGLQRCFAASFPVKGLLESAGRFLGSLRPEISLDPQTGSPSVSLHPDAADSPLALQTLWERIARITEEIDSLVVLDEFQDVALVEEAPAQLRTCLEALGDVPVLLLGSKRHMLAELFAAPGAPLAGWGTDLEFRSIPYDDYHAYIEERFSQRRLAIAREVSRGLQDDMQRVPEAINRLCAQIMELHERTEIGPEHVRSALLKLLENREGRHASYLSAFSGTDETVLTEIARRGTVEHPQSKRFLGGVGLSSRTVALSFRRLWNQGVIELVAGGYRIADPCSPPISFGTADRAAARTRSSCGPRLDSAADRSVIAAGCRPPRARTDGRARTESRPARYGRSARPAFGRWSRSATSAGRRR